MLGCAFACYGCHCSLQEFYKGACVTMWCPVFLQTEDKVGLSALTESPTCFRPNTDHTTHIYKLNKQHSRAYPPYIEPCASWLIHYTNTTWLSIIYLLVKGSGINLIVESSWIIVSGCSCTLCGIGELLTY